MTYAESLDILTLPPSDLEDYELALDICIRGY